MKIRVHWDWKSWYGNLVAGLVFTSIYVMYLADYDSMIIEIRECDDCYTKNYSYINLMSLLDRLFGKVGAIAILGALTLIPFVLAGYKVRKRLKNGQRLFTFFEVIPKKDSKE